MKVLDSGPLDAKIMIVYESPGTTEEQTGRHMTGASGKLFKQMLLHVGVDFSACYVTTLSDERPPSGNFTYFYEGKSKKDPSERLIKWSSLLRSKIESIRPNIVIALGAESLKAITNRKGIEAWRGNILTYKDVKIIPTYNPKSVIKNYGLHAIVEMDLAKAARESISKDVKTNNANIIIQPTLNQVLDWIKECETYPRVAYDIETIGKHVRCISFARGSTEKPDAIVIPFIKFPSTDMAMPGSRNIISMGNVSEQMSSYWNTHDELLVLDAIASLLESPYIQKVGHNSISFDAPIMEEEFGILTNNHIMDTMHAFHLLYSEFPKGLDFLVSILTDYNNYWTDKQTDNDKSEWYYCGMDSVATLVISYKLNTELCSSGMNDLYKTVNKIALAFADIQKRGICIDDEARLKLIKEQKIKESGLLESIRLVAGKTFNPNSPKQVKELMYDKLKFPIMYKDDKPSTDEVVMRKLMTRYPNDTVIRDIIGYRKVTKLINTFLEMKFDEDGKMRTSYNVSGTKGARVSSSETLWGTGMNLQNIPVGKGKGVENIRNLFIPSEGKVFVHADLAQAEALVVAEILRRYGYDELYNLHKDKNFDVHKWMAAKIFNKAECDITKHERDIGKLANHSGNYGSGPNVLVNKAAKEEMEGVDYAMANKILAARHRAIPGLKVWWADVESKLRRTRTLSTCFGRKRIFFGRLDETTYRDAYSFEPQSTVGELMNVILEKVEHNVNSKIKLFMQVHDEIDGECLIEDVPEAYKEIKEASLVPLYINDFPLIIPIEIEFGSNWKDTIPYEEFISKSGLTLSIPVNGTENGLVK